jgi:hypothetical protein
MPTAAKFVSAVAFALVAAILAQVYIPLLPEGTQTAMLTPVSAGLGLVIGWQVMGRNVGKPYTEAAATGIRTALTVVFFALLGFAIAEMLHRSTRMVYHGPMEAVLAVFSLCLDYGRLMLDRTFLICIAVGGVVGGLVAEFTGRRWS